MASMRTHLAILLVQGVLLLSGCSETPSSPAGAASEATGAHHIRIVSLSPAISRTLVDLDIADLIVGRTPYCASLDRAIPVVGDLHDLDYEMLIRVRPTHVLVQPPASGINPRVVEMAEKRNWSLHMWRLDRFTDIGELVKDLPNVVFTNSIEGKYHALVRASELLDGMLKIVESYDPDAPSSPRTLLIFGVDPVSAFGTETYLYEVFAALGGRNATDVKGYPQFTLEDVARMNPEAVILVRPGVERDDRAVFGPIARMEIDAVKHDRLAVLTHPDALLPSSAVIGVAEELQAILQEFP